MGCIGKSAPVWLLALACGLGCSEAPAANDAGASAGQGDTTGGCGDPCPSAVPAVHSQEVVDPLSGVAFELVVDAPARTLTLRRAGAKEALTTLRVDRWRVGVVDAFDPSFNHDPSLLPGSAPGGLRWAAVTAMTTEPVPVADAAGPGGAEERASYRLDTTFEADAGPLAGKPGPSLRLQRPLKSSHHALTIRPADDGLAAAWDKDQPSADGSGRIVYLQVETTAAAGEGFEGLGEFFDSPLHRGKRRTTQLQGNFNLDGASNEAHTRIPLLVSSRGWGVLVHSYRPMDFDVAATRSDALQITIAWHEAELRLLAAARPLDVVGQYWRQTGRPALPAPWAVGGLLWRNENEDQAEVLQDMADVRKHDLAISGFWIDRPYDTAVNDFGFHPGMFPDPKAMITALHDHGLRLGLWSTPYFDPGYDDKPVCKHHAEAKAKGWFVKGPGAGAKLLKWGPPLDLTQPDAAAYLRKQIGNYESLGIEGYKLDYGEDVVVGLLALRIPWLFASGEDERTLHRRWQLLYHAPYADSLPKLDGLKGGGFLLARCSALGDQIYTSMIWPGDLCASWHRHGECDADGKCHAGGLPASVAAAISLPMSGLPLYGADTGGYRHGRAPKELFLRWLQHTALTGVLQIGGGSDHHPWLSKPINNKAAPGSVFDDETLKLSRELVRLHARLFPVIWSDLRAAHDEYRGVGPIRSLAMSLPEHAARAEVIARGGDEHFFGDHLLVAPVIAQVAERPVFVPPGRWIDFFDGSVLDGGEAGKTVTVAAPLAKLPLYLRAGAVLPLLRPTIDTLAPSKVAGIDSFANDPGILWARVDLGSAPARGATDALGQTKLFDGTVLRASDGGGGKVVLDHGAGSVFQKGLVWQLRGLGQSPTAIRRAGVLVEKLETAAAPDAAAAEAKVAGCSGDCWALAADLQVFVRTSKAGSLEVTP